jgi:hypothetical protein
VTAEADKPLPWTPAESLRADATDEQMAARYWEFYARVGPKAGGYRPPQCAIMVAREYAAACVVEKDAQIAILRKLYPCPACDAVCKEALRASPALRDAPADTARLDLIEEYLDGFKFQPLTEQKIVCDWFVGDGGGHFYTTGKTLRAATDLALKQFGASTPSRLSGDNT